jgi:hypothetical protein
MDAWAGSSFGSKANFVCVCVAGSVDLALQFGRELKLRHCLNGVIVDNSQMPKWGQLGCNGLIVLNEKLEVVVPASKAFMEVREAAFRDVEGVLQRLLAPKPVFASGVHVRLLGLKGSAHLNGATAVVIAPAPSADGRNLVRLDSHLPGEAQQEVQIKTANLTRADGTYSIGEHVVLTGLRGSAHLNGLAAVVVQIASSQGERNLVRLLDGAKQEIKVKTENLCKGISSPNDPVFGKVEVDQPVPSKA